MISLPSRITRQVPELVEQAVDVTLPVAEQVQGAVSLTPAGHLRPLHWAALGVFLWLVGAAPILVGIREEWVLELPWALSLAGGWCILHAVATAAAQHPSSARDGEV